VGRIVINGEELDTTTVAGKKKEIKVGGLITFIFLLVVALLGFLNYDFYVKTNIQRYGEVAIATVEKCTANKDDDGDITSYDLKFVYDFVGPNGETEVRTGFATSGRRISPGNKVSIKYDQNGRTVVNGYYTESFFLNAGFLFIIFAVFAAVEVWFIINFFLAIASYKTMKAFVAGNGEIFKATFLGTKMNRDGSYRIKYMWEAKNGRMHEGKSLSSYSHRQVEFYENKGDFDIRCHKRVTDIVPQEGARTHQEAMKSAIQRYEYCKTVIPKGETTCPGCGAKI
jgi:hypothetical protein